MKKINRLLKNKDFKNVLEYKKSSACSEFIVYKKENTLNYARIGISVGSKIGNSVVRHRVKRQINEMIKQIFDLNRGEDIVIIVRKGFLNNNFARNGEILNKIINKNIERGKI